MKTTEIPKTLEEQMARGEIFHAAIKDGRKVTVLKRKIQTENDKHVG